MVCDISLRLRFIFHVQNRRQGVTNPLFIAWGEWDVELRNYRKTVSPPTGVSRPPYRCHHVAVCSYHEDGPRAAARREVPLHQARKTGALRRVHVEECNGQTPPNCIHLRPILDRHGHSGVVADLHEQQDRLLYEQAVQSNLYGDAA